MLRASSEHPSQLGCGFRLLPPLLVFGQFLIPLLEKSLTLPSLPPPLQNGMPFVNFPRSQLQLCDLCSSLYHNSPVSSFELPWQLSWLRIRLQCRRPLFDSWVGKICWRRDGLPTPVFWPGEFQGLYSPWGHKELDTTERLSLYWSIVVPIQVHRQSNKDTYRESIGGTTLCSAKKPESYLFLLLPYKYQHTKVWSKENRKRNAIWDVIIQELLIILNK